MTIDLDAMKRPELEKLIKDAEKALERAHERNRRDARLAAEKAVAEYGFSLDELDMPGDGKRSATKKPGGSRTHAAPKFANPADPSQTWTGKGRQPNWYRAEVEKGTAPDEMLI